MRSALNAVTATMDPLNPEPTRRSTHIVQGLLAVATGPARLAALALGVALLASGCATSTPRTGPLPPAAAPPQADTLAVLDDPVEQPPSASGVGAVDPATAVFIRVVDVGQGLATVARLPGGHYVVYDAGDLSDGRRAFAGIASVVPPGEEIDLMILSHADRDHISAVDEVFDAYTVRRVIRTGFLNEDTTDVWRAADRAIRAGAAGDQTVDVNLQHCELPPGATYRFSDAFVTILAGQPEPPDAWGLTDDGERKNAVSIVARIYYHGRSVLLAGDAVGRHSGQPADADPIATERTLLDYAPVLPLRSDVLVAPHHGADNASSTAFIEAVAPTWVVFSSGSHRGFQHPRAVTAERYLAAGVAPGNVLRTDLGDDDGALEWDHGRIPDSRDPHGDDDVDVWLTEDGNVFVLYHEAHD